MASKSSSLMTAFGYRALFLVMLITAAKLTSFNVAQSTDSDWTFDETEFTGCNKAEDYFKRRDFHLNAEISYDTDHCGNLIPDGAGDTEDTSPSQLCLCQRRRYPVKEYNKEDVVRCFDSLSAKRKGKRMHIAFIGDSLIRQVFLSFLRLFPDNDRKMRRSSTRHAEYHFHEDRNVTSRLLNGLLVSFQWRHQIRKDLIANFKRWSTAVEDKVPDLIFLGVTAHHITHNEITNSLEMYVRLFENKLLPLINASLNLHPRQEIVWMRASPTLDYIGPSWDRLNHDVVYDKILKYNDNIIRIFKDTRVVIWDAVNIVVEEYLRACAITKIERQDTAEYMNCKDVMHPGFGALAIAAQLIMNHICCPVA